MSLSTLRNLPASELLACLKCIRTAHGRVENDDAIPLDVECTFPRTASYKCHQCNARRDTGCEPVSDFALA